MRSPRSTGAHARTFLARIALLGSCWLAASCALEPSDPEPDIGEESAELASPNTLGLVFGTNVPGQSAAEINQLADKAAATGIRWAIVEVRWSYTEPNEPTATPTGPNDVLGPQLGYHHYDFGSLDAIVAALKARSIEPVIKIFKHPRWAGGQSCDIFEAPCGIIFNSHKQKFRNGVFDLAYNLANRYRTVKYWALWNEPNLDQSFSPQPPLFGDGLINEYLGTVAIPMKQAIRTFIPDSIIVGPDLFTCSSGDDCEQKDKNWDYRTKVSLWVDSIAQFNRDLFDVISFHNYGTDERDVIQAANLVRFYMQRRSLFKPMWTTEFNFRSGTCDSNEQGIAAWTYALGRDMTWERVFLYSLVDSNQTCGFGLLTNPGHPAGGLQPKSYLYPAFTRIVGGGGP
jgi:hypothetical protein